MQTILKNDFYLDISRVVLAHEFVMTNSNRCDYSRGRGVFGISLALSGEAEYSFSDGERITVREGDLILLPETAVYTISVRSPYRHYTANFTVRGETSDEIPTENGIVLHKTHSSAFRDTFRELIAARSERGCGFEVRSVMLVYSMLARLIAELSDESGGSHRLLPVKQYIDKNYRRSISLAELAELADMSVTNFRRLFLSAYGVTPMRYRDSVRLSAAKEYLSSGLLSVTEVARLSGFEDTAYFVRFFKKNLGLTPGEYKQKLYEEMRL